MTADDRATDPAIEPPFEPANPFDTHPLAPDQVRRRQFVTVRRGFDPDQVREFLERVADQMETMQSMLREARMEAESGTRAPGPRVDAYHQLAARFADTLRSADEQAERIRREATEDARRLLEEARADADRVRTIAQAKAEDARATAERALREARELADQTIAGLSTRRDALVEQLAQMQERLLGVAHDIEAAIEGDLANDEPSPIFVADAGPEGAPDGEPAKQAQRVSTGGSGGSRSDRESANVGPPRQARRGEENGDAPGSPIEPGYDALWEGTETIHLEVPEIPPLDLSWGDDDDV